MHTRCPGCQAVFRVTSAQLDAAAGRVRCGECGRAFDARPSLQRELPLEAYRVPPTGVQADLFGRGADAADTGAERAESGLSRLLIADLDSEASAGEKARRRRRSPLALAAWGLANAGLVVALLGQIVFIQRDAFAQHPGVRPVLAEVCALADCQLPARRDVDRIEVVRRHVYSHPNVDDALIMDVTLVNEAPYAQPFPTLSVTLADIDGDAVARRHFEPSDYDPGLAPFARMAPGSPVTVSLAVRDPGPQARTFRIDFD